MLLLLLLPVSQETGCSTVYAGLMTIHRCTLPQTAGHRGCRLLTMVTIMV